MNPRAIGAPRRPLTAREVQVLKLVADGLTNAEIGRNLRVGEETIKSNVQTILRALGARNRWHAVGCGFRLGVLT